MNMETREDMEKKLKMLFDFDEQQQPDTNEQEKKQYETLTENHPSCNETNTEESIEELTKKLEKYKRGDFSDDN